MPCDEDGERAQGELELTRDTLETDGNWVLTTAHGRLDVMAYVEDTSGEITSETRRANRPQDRIDIAALGLARGDEA